MKKKLMALLLVAGGSLLAQTHFSIGVGIGAPGFYRPAPVAAFAYRPPVPGPGYVWVDGYYDGWGGWISGYWALPPYAGTYWVAPRFYGGRWFAGYWNGPRHFDRDDFRLRGEFREGFRGEFREHGRR